MKAASHFTIIGCGPGGAQCLTEEARQAVRSATALYGTERLLELFPEVPARRHPFRGSVSRLLEMLAASEEESVAILVTGDPGVASLAKPLLARFGRSRCRVVPGLSSVQVACARLGLCWESAAIVNAHGGAPTKDPPAEADPLVVLLGGNEGQRWVQETLLPRTKGREIWACENLTLASERVHRLSSAEPSLVGLPTRTVLVLTTQEVVP